jgi:lysophospholipase L1-like esterase
MPSEEERLTRIIQFLHPERMWPPITDEHHARSIGADLQTYRAIRARLADGVWQAAQALVADAEFASGIEHLPFRPGSTVVCLGDSLTEDSQSWAELFKAVLTIHRPQDEINLVNEGVSGASVADTLRRMTAVMAHRPDWVICLLGTNDASWYGVPPIGPLSTHAETERNIDLLRQMGAACTRWVWIAPPPCLELLVAEDWFLSSIPVRFHNQDLSAIAEAVKRRPEPVVALEGFEDNPALFLSDGLHVSLAGQSHILRTLVKTLASGRLRQAENETKSRSS